MVNNLNFYQKFYNQYIFYILNEFKTSIFVITKSVTPLIKIEYFSAGKSNQPHLLDLPVVDPNSFPNFCILSPISPSSSVVNGPDQTLVQ